MPISSPVLKIASPASGSRASKFTISTFCGPNDPVWHRSIGYDKIVRKIDPRNPRKKRGGADLPSVERLVQLEMSPGEWVVG